MQKNTANAADTPAANRAGNAERGASSASNLRLRIVEGVRLSPAGNYCEFTMPARSAA